MKLNKTLAVALHRAMWTDMRTELGDNPSPNQRACFKETWIKEHFPDEYVMQNCFLCEYALKGKVHSCDACPIVWPGGHCTGYDFSYCTAPISDILALPEKNKKCADLPDDCKKYVTHDETAAELLSKASGLPGSVSVEDHVKAIKEKAMQQSTFSVMYSVAKTELAKASGLPEADGIIAHIKAIQEKAVEEYFKKTPGAKLATMDVDQAFKQYADEQKAPIFKQLSKASGLSENYHTVFDHIELIKNKARQEGRDETKQQMKDLLAKESNLDCNRPIDDHIHEIVKYSKEIGAAEERDRIQEKIYEVLLS